MHGCWTPSCVRQVLQKRSGPPRLEGVRFFFSRLAENAYGFAFTDGVFVGPWPVQDEQ
jgi:hypothetical protein